MFGGQPGEGPGLGSLERDRRKAEPRTAWVLEAALWEHSCVLSTSSLLSQDPSPLPVTPGGCRPPRPPLQQDPAPHQYPLKPSPVALVASLLPLTKCLVLAHTRPSPVRTSPLVRPVSGPPDSSQFQKGTGPWHSSAHLASVQGSNKDPRHSAGQKGSDGMYFPLSAEPRAQCLVLPCLPFPCPLATQANFHVCQFSRFLVLRTLIPFRCAWRRLPSLGLVLWLGRQSVLGGWPAPWSSVWGAHPVHVWGQLGASAVKPPSPVWMPY